MINASYNQLKRHINKIGCEKQLVKVTDTPPIKYHESDDVVVFSMLGKQYLSAYLVAVKSFLYWFRNANVHILNDGSLDPTDIDVLAKHIPNIEISSIADVDVGLMPTGGCWERLIKLIELSENSYVIQLDSDIVVNGPLPEILRAIEMQYSFVIGSPRWEEPTPVEYLSNVAKIWASSHVQTIAEQALSSLPVISGRNIKFVRGCAGFSGFPKGAVNRNNLEKFSKQMEDAIGRDKWSEWGSEQVSSNYIASICPGAHVLPWPKYQNYAHPISSGPVENASVVHFMGSNRYDHGAYQRIANQVIQSLMSMPCL